MLNSFKVVKKLHINTKLNGRINIRWPPSAPAPSLSSYNILATTLTKCRIKREGVWFSACQVYNANVNHGESKRYYLISLLLYDAGVHISITHPFSYILHLLNLQHVSAPYAGPSYIKSVFALRFRQRGSERDYLCWLYGRDVRLVSVCLMGITPRRWKLHVLIWRWTGSERIYQFSFSWWKTPLNYPSSKQVFLLIACHLNNICYMQLLLS